MNKLRLGLYDKADLLDTDEAALLIDEGPLCEDFLRLHKNAKIFDFNEHGLNPLPCVHPQTRNLAKILYGPEGKDTLTVRNGKRALTRKFKNATRLDRISFNNGDDEKEAHALIADLLQSPVLKRVLRKPIPRWFFSGVPVLVRLDRAEVGDDDAFILGSILATTYPGHVIIPDFELYARRFYMPMIKKGRLSIGLNTLEELDDKKLRQMVLLIADKDGRGCNFDDAETLAKYARHVPDTNAFSSFVTQRM